MLRIDSIIHKIQSITSQEISLVNINFDPHIYFYGSIFVLTFIVLSWIFFKTFSSSYKPKEFVRLFLYNVFIFSLTVFIGLAGYLLWKNHFDPPQKYIVPEEILPNTSWVKQDQEIFYVYKKRYLKSIFIDGHSDKVHLAADSDILSYHFSPNGDKVAVITKTKILLKNFSSNVIQVVDSISQANQKSYNVKGSLIGIKWAPDSQKFCYKKILRSDISSQENVYMYDLIKKKNVLIDLLGGNISSFYWGKDSRNIFYLIYKATNPSISEASFEILVKKVSLGKSYHQLLFRFFSDTRDIPAENLRMRGVDLFLKGNSLSFDDSKSSPPLESEKGDILGFDEEDYLYVKNSLWGRKRLFKVQREGSEANLKRYPFKSGDFFITNILWLPQGKYVLLEHKNLSVLILDPWEGIIGQLPIFDVSHVGWYDN